MANDTNPTKVGTNPLALPWPTDPFGFTSSFKAEAVKSVQRINGDANKFEVFTATMQVIMKFAGEKYAAQKASNAEALEVAMEKERIEATREDRERAEKIAEAEAKLAALKAELGVEDEPVTE